MLNKIIKFLWIAFFAFLVLLIQFKLQGTLRPLVNWIQGLENLFINPLFWGFAIGVIFGLITCPICGVPLATYVVGKEEKLVAAVFSSLLFTLGRFMIFLILGILGGLIGKAILDQGLFNILGLIFALAGIFMLVLSCDLSGLIDIKKFTTNRIVRRLHLRPNRLFKDLNHPWEYFIWGALLGVVCSLEGFAFVLPVWTAAVASANIFYAVLVMCIFAVGAFIPPTILIFTALGSVRLANKLFKGNFMHSVRQVGAVVLFIAGCAYIFFGLKNARLLLFGIG